MSTRQIRRFRERLEAAKLDKNEDPESEDDFEPLYVTRQKGSFNLLSTARDGKALESSDLSEINENFSMLMSDSPESPDRGSDKEVTSDEPTPSASKKKKKNNRKKKNNKKREKKAASTEVVDEDEVERAVAEVNSMLGEPSTPAAAVTPPEESCARALLGVNYKFLSGEDELTRRFGPDEEEGRRNQRPNVLRQLKRHIMLPKESYKFSVSGLSMAQIGTKNGMKCFKFVHSPRYQLCVRGLVGAVKYQLASMGPPEFDLYNVITIEALLQNVDLYFMLEETSAACTSLEGAIYFLQGLFCPFFSYTDGKTLLEYEIVENRPFHIILLKYLHLLTNKACHRTALEVAKILVNLDPSDPLGVIFIMDTIALRAREHQWLVDIYQYWSKERDARRLFHLMYSHALARYHIYLKSKKDEDLAVADRYMKEAIMEYPNVATMLIAHCQQRCPEMTNHELFTRLAVSTTSKDLRELQELYIAFAGPKYREGNIAKWLVSHVLKLIEEFDNDTQVKFDCYAAASLRYLMFRENPIEIKRHLFLIKSMSYLLVEGAVPHVKDTYSFNPYPKKGRCFDANHYFTERPPPDESSGWRSFLESLVPLTTPGNNE